MRETIDKAMQAPASMASAVAGLTDAHEAILVAQAQLHSPDINSTAAIERYENIDLLELLGETGGRSRLTHRDSPSRLRLYAGLTPLSGGRRGFSITSAEAVAILTVPPSTRTAIDSSQHFGRGARGHPDVASLSEGKTLIA